MMLKVVVDCAPRYDEDGRPVPPVTTMLPLTAEEEAEVLARQAATAPMETTASPNPASVGDVVTMSAVVPPEAPDTSVTFQVSGGSAYTEPLSNGVASHVYAFSLPGTYVVTVSCGAHPTEAVQVVVQ